ncbi:MAG: helix-turn-helix domain-containing protein [archaeon]
MILKPELLKKIRSSFGLNIYEAKVWLALLAKGVSSAGEIAEMSGVPRSRTYDVLESLEKQGFAIEKIGKPVKYIAVKPDTVLEKLKRNTMTEAEERAKTLSNLKGTSEYDELEVLHKQGITPVKSTDLSGALKGRSNIYSQLAEMLENAKEEIILVTTDKSLQDEMKVLKPICTKLAKHGIKIKIAANADAEKTKQLSKELGTEVRNMSLNARFCIIDGKSIMFMLTDKADEKEEDLGIWINSEFFAAALKSLFDMAWQKP